MICVRFLWMISVALLLVGFPLEGRGEDGQEIDPYIQSYKYKIPAWKKGRLQKELKFLSIPYDSKGRVPLLKSFSGRCDAIGIGSRRNPTTLEKNVHIFSLQWSANSTDGDLLLTILPNFIYLRTSHVNPNPDIFLWYSYLSEFQYTAFEKFFRGALKDGTISILDKSMPDAATWKPMYVENYSIAYGDVSAYSLSTALWRHYVSANVNCLFDLVNRHLSERTAWLRFPGWKEYGDEELGILFETYLPDELEGGAGAREIAPRKGMHIYSTEFWVSRERPISFRVSNEDDRKVHFAVEAEVLQGKRVAANFPDILTKVGERRNILSLPAHSSETFTWMIPTLDKKWGQGGKFSIRLKLLYGYGQYSALTKTIVSYPFTVGYPETLEDIFSLPEHREALLELYYRLKERQLRQGFQSLNAEEALLVDLWDLQGNFGHGAWEGKQYLIHHGDRAAGIESALRKIGSPCLAAHFGRIVNQFAGKKIPANPQDIKKALETWGDTEDARLTGLGESFWAKYDHNQNAVCKEDLNGLLYQYVSIHRSKIR